MQAQVTTARWVKLRWVERLISMTSFSIKPNLLLCCRARTVDTKAQANVKLFLKQSNHPKALPEVHHWENWRTRMPGKSKGAMRVAEWSVLQWVRGAPGWVLGSFFIIVSNSCLMADVFWDKWGDVGTMSRCLWFWKLFYSFYTSMILLFFHFASLILEKWSPSKSCFW